MSKTAETADQVQQEITSVDETVLSSIEVRPSPTQAMKSSHWKEIWIFVLSTVIALVSVLATTYIQIENNRTQNDFRKYEVQLRPKQEGCSQFMKSLGEASRYFAGGNRPGLDQNLDKMETAYYTLEPFLPEKDRIEVWNKYQEFGSYCYERSVDKQAESDLNRDQVTDQLMEYRQFFRLRLYDVLFK